MSVKEHLLTYMTFPVAEWIAKSFPTLESHYGRSTAAKGKYLSLPISVSRMYGMYLEKFEPHEYAKGKDRNPIIKYEFYRNYF